MTVMLREGKLCELRYLKENGVNPSSGCGIEFLNCGQSVWGERHGGNGVWFTQGPELGGIDLEGCSIVSRIWLRVWLSGAKLRRDWETRVLFLKFLLKVNVQASCGGCGVPAGLRDSQDLRASVLWGGRQDQLHRCASQVLLLLKR